MRVTRPGLLIAVAAVLSVAAVHRSAPPQIVNGPFDPPGTFSVLGFDPATGAIGAAVQSRVFSVGNGVLWAEAGVGAVATQAIVDVGYGPKAMQLLKQGMAPADIIRKIWDEDPDPGYGGQKWQKAGRQFAVMNAQGEVAAFTGPEAPTEFGDKQDTFCTAQGNTLGSKDVPAAMCAAFESTEKDANGNRTHLSLRLLAAIEAGQAAGGDKRGMQSAAMIVVKKDCGVWLHNDVEIKLQVDDSPEPIKELRRLVELWNRSQKRRGC
jgi:uncharacterized Ntn-hydrolase superfamily protein